MECVGDPDVLTVMEHNEVMLMSRLYCHIVDRPQAPVTKVIAELLLFMYYGAFNILVY